MPPNPDDASVHTMSSEYIIMYIEIQPTTRIPGLLATEGGSEGSDAPEAWQYTIRHSNKSTIACKNDHQLQHIIA